MIRIEKSTSLFQYELQVKAPLAIVGFFPDYQYFPFHGKYIEYFAVPNTVAFFTSFFNPSVKVSVDYPLKTDNSIKLKLSYVGEYLRSIIHQSAIDKRQHVLSLGITVSK
ncbi:MAG: hypothetical protein ACK5KP_07260 [Paludibacteraceae bacterium]